MNIENIPNINDIILLPNEYMRVGSPELDRNDVFFDKTNNIYIKYYKNKKHFLSEKKALNFYKDEVLVPNIIFEKEMCLCMEAINGMPFFEHYLSQSAYHKMGQTLKIFHDKFKIHSCMYNEILEDYGVTDYYALEYRRLKKTFNRLSSSFKFKEIEIIASNLLFELNKECCLLKDFVLCHNDYCNRNVLQNEGKIVGIIDFEKSYYADSTCDLSTIIIKEFGTENLDAFINSYFGSTISLVDKKKMAYFSIIKALEIISWAKTKDYTYYLKAINLLSNWKKIYEI